jgi:uncharacterized protein involved in type VI secretion and phage assembly
MEQSGSFYYFEHDSKKHTLVLADSPSVHADCPGQSTFLLQETTGPGGLPDNEDVVTAWRLE